MTTIFFAQSTGAGKWKTIDDQTEKQNLLLKYMKKEKYMVK
jgi:hypothetical protein